MKIVVGYIMENHSINGKFKIKPKKFYHKELTEEEFLKWYKDLTNKDYEQK